MKVFKNGVWWISRYTAILTPNEGSAPASDGKWSMMENFWPLPTLRRYSTYGLERGLTHNFMFFVRVRTCTWCHKIECKKAAETIIAREPLDTTGGHCQKSPVNSGWVCSQTTSNRGLNSSPLTHKVGELCGITWNKNTISFFSIRGFTAARFGWGLSRDRGAPTNHELPNQKFANKH